MSQSSFISLKPKLSIPQILAQVLFNVDQQLNYALHNRARWFALGDRYELVYVDKYVTHNNEKKKWVKVRRMNDKKWTKPLVLKHGFTSLVTALSSSGNIEFKLRDISWFLYHGMQSFLRYEKQKVKGKHNEEKSAVEDGLYQKNQSKKLVQENKLLRKQLKQRTNELMQIQLKYIPIIENLNALLKEKDKEIEIQRERATDAFQELERIYAERDNLKLKLMEKDQIIQHMKKQVDKYKRKPDRETFRDSIIEIKRGYQQRIQQLKQEYKQNIGELEVNQSSNEQMKDNHYANSDAYKTVNNILNDKVERLNDEILKLKQERQECQRRAEVAESLLRAKETEIKELKKKIQKLWQINVDNNYIQKEQILKEADDVNDDNYENKEERLNGQIIPKINNNKRIVREGIESMNSDKGIEWPSIKHIINPRDRAGSEESSTFTIQSGDKTEMHTSPNVKAKLPKPKTKGQWL